MLRQITPKQKGELCNNIVELQQNVKIWFQHFDPQSNLAAFEQLEIVFKSTLINLCNIAINIDMHKIKLLSSISSKANKV
jgi:hypothetical protein